MGPKKQLSMENMIKHSKIRRQGSDIIKFLRNVGKTDRKCRVETREYYGCCSLQQAHGYSG
jgi:hypothetical protein